VRILPFGSVIKISMLQPSSYPRPAAALAFYDFVALLQQALALAILAFLLLS